MFLDQNFVFLNEDFLMKNFFYNILTGHIFWGGKAELLLWQSATRSDCLELTAWRLLGFGMLRMLTDDQDIFVLTVVVCIHSALEVLKENLTFV